ARFSGCCQDRVREIGLSEIRNAQPAQTCKAKDQTWMVICHHRLCIRPSAAAKPAALVISARVAEGYSSFRNRSVPVRLVDTATRFPTTVCRVRQVPPTCSWKVARARRPADV